jgi:F-type H+-transporting ATPase subunit b
VVSRIRPVLALALFILLVSAVRVTPIHAQQPKEGAGAAQPEPKEQNPEAPSKAEDGAADEVKNSAAVRGLAHLTGLDNEKAYWLSVGLNFGIVVLVIAWLAKKNVPDIFKSRNDSIQKSIEEARKTGEEAKRRLSEVESRLSRLDAEIGQMRREAEENARAEEQRIQAEVEEERSRIVSAAEQEIAAASGSARRELKAYAAELAVELARKKIKVERDTDQMLVREFTSQLGKDGN